MYDDERHLQLRGELLQQLGSRRKRRGHRGYQVPMLVLAGIAKCTDEVV